MLRGVDQDALAQKPEDFTRFMQEMDGHVGFDTASSWK